MSTISIDQQFNEKQDAKCILCEGQHGNNTMCQYTEVDHEIL